MGLVQLTRSSLVILVVCSSKAFASESLGTVFTGTNLGKEKEQTRQFIDIITFII